MNTKPSKQFRLSLQLFFTTVVLIFLLGCSFIFLYESFKHFPVLVFHNPDLTIDEIIVVYDKNRFTYDTKYIKKLTVIRYVRDSHVDFEIKSGETVEKYSIYVEGPTKDEIYFDEEIKVKRDYKFELKMLYFYNKRNAVLSEKLVDDKKVVEVEYFDDTVNKNFN